MIPNLIHPARIVIRQTNRAGTTYDDDAREAIQIVERSADVVIMGQPKFQAEGEGVSKVTFTENGRQLEAAGYILFRKVDLDSLGVTLDAGDQVVQIGHLEVDLYIMRLVPTGHYPDQSGASLFKAYLEDRAATRNDPGEA